MQPLTHSVLNSVKRAVVIVSAIVLFNTPVWQSPDYRQSRLLSARWMVEVHFDGNGDGQHPFGQYRRWSKHRTPGGAGGVSATPPMPCLWIVTPPGQSKWALAMPNAGQVDFDHPPVREYSRDGGSRRPCYSSYHAGLDGHPVAGAPGLGLTQELPESGAPAQPIAPPRWPQEGARAPPASPPARGRRRLLRV